MPDDVIVESACETWKVTAGDGVRSKGSTSFNKIVERFYLSHKINESYRATLAVFP